MPEHKAFDMLRLALQDELEEARIGGGWHEQVTIADIAALICRILSTDELRETLHNFVAELDGDPLYYAERRIEALEKKLAEMTKRVFPAE
jgi:hypothetical protein